MLPLAIAISALGPRIAKAETAARAAAAEALFRQARDEMRRGDYESACPKLAESERLDPSSGTLLNLIVCEERLGRLAAAWVYASELVGRLAPYDDRKPIAERKLAALTQRVPRLTVRLSSRAPPDTKVVLDGVELGPSSLGLPVPVDPGAHSLVVTSKGRLERTAKLTMEEGRVYEWLAEPGAELDENTSTASAPARTFAAGGRDARKRPRSARPSESSSPPRWLGWTAAGLGVAALAVGAVMGLMTLDRQRDVSDNCPNKVCSNASYLDVAADGRRLFVGALVAFGVGAAGLGAGIFVLTRNDARDSRVASSPTAFRAPSAGVLTIGAHF